MYSVILMMAMGGSGEMTALHRCSGACSGCNACHGRSACHGCASSRRGCHCSGRAACSGCYGCCNGSTVIRSSAVESAPPPRRSPEEVRIQQPATIVVSLPADARLFIGEEATRSTTAQRRFQTPPLQPGSDYSYTMKANIDRNGRTVTLTRQVMVRAGEEARVTFTLPAGEGTAEESEPRDTGRDNAKPPLPRQ